MPETPDTQPKPRVVIIDDEQSLLAALRTYLGRSGFDVNAYQDPLEGLAVVETSADVVLLDIRMPNLSGLDLLQEIKSKRPTTQVLMMTAHGTFETAVAAVKAGAYNYLSKPFERLEDVAQAVRKAVEYKRLLDRNQALEGMLEAKQKFEDLIGQSERMRAVYKLIESVSYSSATILVQGESGTGKELVARAIHRRSPRKDKAFIAVNCSAFTETLLESELFGHAKGAFTGAIAHKAGLFEAAHGGTLFLDEVGDITPAVQVRLLRVLQEGEVRRVGSNDTVRVDVRIIAATNVDLEKAKGSGKFREDLFYRLNVIAVHLPPLRERPEDIPLLAQHFLQAHAKKVGKNLSRISPGAMEALTVNRWSGNARELENVLERAVVLASGPEITEADLPPGFTAKASSADVTASSLTRLPYGEAKKLAIRAFERRYLSALLEKAQGNISAAARAAGLDRSNFRRLLRQHDVQVREGEGGDGEPGGVDGPSPA